MRKKHKFILFNLVSSFLISLSPFSASANSKENSILGIWENENQTSHIEFVKNGKTYEARLVWIKDSLDANGSLCKDVRNPDIELRNRPLTGIFIIWNLTYSNEKWRKGSSYFPGTGMTIDCSIDMPDENILLITGRKGFIRRTKTWKRIK